MSGGDDLDREAGVGNSTSAAGAVARVTSRARACPEQGPEVAVQPGPVSATPTAPLSPPANSRAGAESGDRARPFPVQPRD